MTSLNALLPGIKERQSSLSVHYRSGTLHLSVLTVATSLFRYAYSLHFADAEIGKERLFNSLKVM